MLNKGEIVVVCTANTESASSEDGDDTDKLAGPAHSECSDYYNARGVDDLL